MKKTIAIITGGNSSEHEISLYSADNVLENIDKNKYNPFLIELNNNKWIVVKENIEIDLNTFSFYKNGYQVNFDFAFIVIHGKPGEDGSIAGYLNLLNIPHSTCNVLSAALSFNKCVCNTYLNSYGIKTANFISLKKSESFDYKYIKNKTGFPCIVKPSDSGSSVGVSKVNNENGLQKAISIAFKESNHVMIEEFIKGIELSCSILKTQKEEIILPLTEIVFPGEFWDYHHKYFSKKTQEITPARINSHLAQKVQQLSRKIYDLLDCKGIVRLDFILKDEDIYFLELNSIPGITKMSIITNAIKATNYSLTDILTKIIEDS